MKDDNFYLCWSDLAWAIRRRWRLVRLLSMIFAGAFLCYALFSPPKFVSEALFQVKGKQALTSGNVGGIIQLASGSGPNQGVELALTVLESRRVGEGVIRSTGLQIVPQPEGKSLRLLKNLKDNLLAEFAWWLDRPSSATTARNQPWRFCRVSYAGLYPLNFSVIFNKDGDFTVHLPSGKHKGRLGEFFCNKGLRFSIEGDKSALAGRRFDFIAEPMFKAYDRYKRSLNAKMGKRKNGTIAISYVHPSPRLSVDVTNALMHEYLRITKLDAGHIIDEQMRFLARAQEDAWKDLSDQYSEHVNFSKESVAQGGYVRTKDAFAMFTKNYGEITQRLNELEREFAMLEIADPILITTTHTILQKQLSEYNQRLHGLNTRKNSLELALMGSDALKKEVHFYLEAQEKERQKRLSLMGSLKSECDGRYIQSLIASSNMRRRIYETKISAATSPPTEIQGLGLEAATTNYEAHLAALRDLDKKGIALDQAIDKLSNAMFDVGALIDTLGVGVDFQRKVHECHELALALEDRGNYSVKEHARMQEDFRAKHVALKTHLQAVRSVNESQRAKAKEWVQKAQISLLGLIFKEMALVEDEMKRTVARRRTDLKSEIESHRGALSKIKKEMASMPQAWLREKKLDLQTQFQSEMMHALVGLIESRQLSASLDIVESRPLDEALFPIRPKSPNLVLWACIGSLLGLLLGGFYSLIHAALLGFPVSRHNLSVRGQFVVPNKHQEKALFYSNQKVVYCTGLDQKEFLRLVNFAKMQGERVKTVARSCDLAKADITLRRLHATEIQKSVSEEVDRLFVYIPEGPLNAQALSLVGAVGDWIVGLAKEKVRDLTPYFEVSEKSRVAFLLSSAR